MKHSTLHRPSGSPHGATDPATLLVSRDYLPALLARIGAAERSIVLVSYVVSPLIKTTTGPAWTVLQALGQASCRRVGVRVILERSPRERAGSRAARTACRMLIDMGARARLGPPGLTVHSKYAVLDTLHVLLGSHNLTNRSLTRNYEVSVMLAETQIALELSIGFQRLWDRSEDI